MALEMPPGHVPCPACGRPVDKLRAGAVSATEAGLLYYCSAACKSVGPSSPRSQPTRGGSPKAEGAGRRARSSPPPGPARPSEPPPREPEGPAAPRGTSTQESEGARRPAAETSPEPPAREPARDEAPRGADEADAAGGGEPTDDPSVGDEGEEAEGDRGRADASAAERSRESGDDSNEDDDSETSDDETRGHDEADDDEADEEEREEPAPPRETSPARAGRLGSSLQSGLRVLGSLLLVVLAVGAPTFFAGETAEQARLTAAALATLWLAVEAAVAIVRRGWRAGVEEIVVLAGAGLSVVAGLGQGRAGEATTALAAAPAIAAATWLARWAEAMVRGDLVERLSRRTADGAEAGRLVGETQRLWGDSPLVVTAERGWVDPAGGRSSSPTCPTAADVFMRVAAVRGGGASTVGRGAARVALYVSVAIPIVAAAVLVYFCFSEQPATAPALLLAAATVLTMNPRGIRRAWVGPLLRAAGRAAARGILFRDGAALEATARAHWVVFDSRGTLTWGEPRLTSVVPAGTLDADEVLSLAAGAEKAAGDNPLGAAIVRAAEERGLEPVAVRLARHNPGLGISATSPRGDLLVGTRQLLLGQGISVAEADETAAEMEERAETVVFLAVGGRIQGVIGLRDELRPGAESLARKLAALGVEPVLMTGDSRPKADALGRELGFDHVRAEVSPDQWAAQIASLRETGHGIAMVAKPPRHEDTLAAADVGLTLGCAGLDVDSAGVALASDDPTAAVDAVAIARRALRGARLNFYVTAAQMLVGLGLAWLALGLLQQWIVPALVALLSAATPALVVSDALSPRRP